MHGNSKMRISVCRFYKCGRLNIFGMIDRNNTYHGFTTTENINSDKFYRIHGRLLPRNL